MWRRLTRLHTEGGNRIEDSHDSRLPQQIRNDYFLSRSLRYHRCSRSQVSTVTCALVACSDKTCMSRRAAISLLAVLTSVIHPQSTSAYLVDEDVTEKIFAKAEASVVSVANKKRRRGEVIEESIATGIVWDERGYIVTNYHCIQPTFQDQTGSMFTVVKVGSPGTQQQELEAKISQIDPDHDIAVLKVNVPNGKLTPVKIGTSRDLKVGQSVFAMGSSYGLSKTFTAGVVSALGRGIPTPTGAIATGAIQTDASINQGNSGGPLLDSSGRLIGISTATFSSNKSQGRGSGVNFAISVDTLRDIVPKLIVYGNAYGKS